MLGRKRAILLTAGLVSLLAGGALFFSCEQAAGPFVPEAEETPETEGTMEPVRYRAAANGVNGEENSTVILFTFDEDVADLRAGNISLTMGGGDKGGAVYKGSLAGSGKEWSLGVAVQSAGTVTVAINKDGIEEGEKPVTVYKATEKTRISFNAAADGGIRRVSSAISFTFGAAIADLRAEDITIAGDVSAGAGSVTPGALSGEGQTWSLGIAVDAPGEIRVGIARDDVETGERTLAVHKPLAYRAAADGVDGEEVSTKIDFSFAAELEGLTAEDISLDPGDIAAKGALTGSGTSWSLALAVAKAGDVQVGVHRDGVDDGERTVSLYHFSKPLGYTVTANGVNGREDSTALLFAFDEELAGLRAGQISLANGEGETGGIVVKGELTGSGKQWSLGIAVQKAGSIQVAINRTGVEAGEKPVALYRAQEQTIIGYAAAADGGIRRASSAITLTFGAALANLSAADITVSSGTGSVRKGALAGNGQTWSLGIAVETPGEIRVAVAKAGVETGEKTLAVHRPIAYGITSDGAANTTPSTKIDFVFAAELAGLAAGDMSIAPADSVTIGALSGGGTSWSLGITVVKAGAIRVRIHRDGIEDSEKLLTVHQYKPIGYTATANGVNGREDSNALVLAFDGDVPDLRPEHLSLANGTGSVVQGGLTGSGRQWTLGIAVQTPGNLRIAIHKTGVEDGEKTVDVYKAAEQTLVSYHAAANGGGKTASSAIALSFGEPVALAAVDITVSSGTGSVRRGALSGGGRNWSLGIAVDTPGDVRVSIAKAGIEGGEKTVAVHKPLTYDAAANSTGGIEASSKINLVFSEAVADLWVGDIRYADLTGIAYPMELFGSGQEWFLTIATVQTGNIKISIDKEGIEGGEKIVAVYKPAEILPEAPVKTGITVISPPDLTLYAKNQSFDRTGLEVGWLYSNGTIEAIPAGGYELEAPDMSIPTSKRVNVRVGSYTASFWIQVLNSDKALSHITVEGPANRTQDFGKDFDRTGLVVTGHYSDGSTASLTSLAAIAGYDKFKRGPQAASVKVNGKTAALEGITTRIGADTAVYINEYLGESYNAQGGRNYKDVYLRGEELSPRSSNIQVLAAPRGTLYRGEIPLTLENGGLTEEDFKTLTGYNPYQTGWQYPSITIDGKQVSFHVRVVDAEPAVWFDYGYMRHSGDPTGHGPGAGRYYAKPGETLVVAPVRYLVGYNTDHSDAGVSYTWTVSGDSSSLAWTTSRGGELLHITPHAAGTYAIGVSVTGRDFVSGSTITKTAATELVCYAGPLPGGTFVSPLRNMGAGQFSEGGNGYGWSLGSAGGYEVWSVEHRASYDIRGNPFGGWNEPGVVWMQEDNNGNGLPDEMWYELRGGEDDDPAWRDYITRRYAVTYFQGDGTAEQHHFPSRYNENRVYYWATYWVDSKGRTGLLPGGFPQPWGVVGNWVTYTCTLLKDNGDIATGNYNGLVATGYVDTFDTIFPVTKAMRADGTPVTLTAVKFIKVQTGMFRYGGLYGDISTEIYQADFLGRQTDFPLP
jgi:methionine-rich copper-binding protein CopC